MGDEGQLNLNEVSERITKLDETLNSFDTLLKTINEEFHKKQNLKDFVNENSEFSVLYMQRKILEAERDRLILKSSYDNLSKSADKFEERLKKLEETAQELAGGLNQIRMALSKITSEKQETQSKVSNIVWSIIIPILVSIVIFVLSLSFKSCSSTIMEDIFREAGNNPGGDYIKF
jgi:tetrahydromethanopterin S-methyltransferase subunit B